MNRCSSSLGLVMWESGKVEVTGMGCYLINVPGVKVCPLGTCWM